MFGVAKLFNRLMIFSTHLLIFLALSNHTTRIGKMVVCKLVSACFQIRFQKTNLFIQLIHFILQISASFISLPDLHQKCETIFLGLAYLPNAVSLCKFLR